MNYTDGVHSPEYLLLILMKSAVPYTEPVNQLLKLDSPDKIEDWSTYLHLGITEADIPELARMAVDRNLFESEDEEAFFALIHAWRTLAELQTDQAIEPLIQALTQWGNQDDWWDWESEEMPLVFGRLGARALPALEQVMANPKYQRYARQDAVRCVEQIFVCDPSSREACIQVLMTQLEKFAKNDPDLNAHLVTTLVIDLKAIESAALVEQAFQANRVNEDFMGDWDDVQVHLGLKQRSELPPRHRNILTNPWQYTHPEPIGFTSGSSKVSKTKAKAKRKLQNQSRRKNRSNRK
jgi:hypothetical protein